MSTNESLRPFWLSWWAEGPFTLHSPWWESGWRYWADDPAQDKTQGSICAAIMATSEEDAKRRILEAHDDKSVTLEWRFVREHDPGWTPFSDRFPQADWMVWP